MKITDLEKRLEGLGVSDPKTEAFLILEHLFGVKRSDVLLEREKDYDETTISKLLEKRSEKIPIQYILGEWSFMDMELAVSPACLIPRPDTEILVYEALRLVKVGGRVADLCTGSGCIALAILKHRPDVLHMSLVDISEDALSVARKNAEKHSLLGKCTLERLDITVSLPSGKFDMIVSNPPYIPSADIEALSDEVKKEPMLALDGGNDGLDIIRALIDKAPTSLNAGGYLLIEFGYDQGDKINAIMSEKQTQGAYKSYKIIKDYGSNDRVLVAQI